ncbi:uncharacterized protein H6S33_005227 [Morchella sextelata]|uniref:uncharacterized protein n=1 Tax=Morchella sextelata TaxID=1174677 RepID=UPI001D0388CA|nr:uncharacterized protein H6S33_005227 [Morchella sextelata]KAH0605245.1 hypothetical protein H6S33_005227 [Morchella sextelata]
MPRFPHLLHRLLCISLPPRPPPKTDPYTISHPYNAHAAPLSSYRRATPPRRRPTWYTRRPSGSTQYTPTQFSQKLTHNPSTRLTHRCSTLSFTCAGLAPTSYHASTASTAEQDQVSAALFARPDSGFGNWLPVQGSTVLCRECELFPALTSCGGLCKHCDKTAKARPRRPVSDAWTISAYERDSFCGTRGSFYEIDERDSFCGPGTWGLEEEEVEEEEVEEEEGGEVMVEGGLDSPTLPYERFFTIGSQPPVPPPTPPLVVVKRGRPEEEEVGSIDFKSSYYARLYRDWISVS